MKSLLLLFISIGFLNQNALSQVNIDEKYFHELIGFEDSTGTTQLFYRLYERIFIQENFETVVNRMDDNVHHLTTETNADSVLLRSYSYEWTIPGMYSEKLTGEYQFHDNDPTKWIRMISYGGGAAPSFQDYSGAGFGFPFPIYVKSKNRFEYQNSGNSFIINNVSDSLYYLLDEITIPFSTDTADWPNFGEDYGAMAHYFDSTRINYQLLAIHPTIDSLYFGINSNGHLFRSEEYSTKFELSDSTVYYSDYSELIFDQNPNFIYSKNSKHLLISDNQGRENSWSKISLPDDLNRLLFATTDSSVSGSLFIADSNSVYSSTDFGSSFNKLLDFDSQITGLYKKPNSEILYVLTRTDLFKVENGTPTSIKQVPVSSESEAELPNSVTLHQNFPNPFNPSTTIQFELNETAFTKLTVYDLLGRKIQELVNEVRPAGTNTIQFNATNLASGIYLYQLEANGIVLTKRLTLIK